MRSISVALLLLYCSVSCTDSPSVRPVRPPAPRRVVTLAPNVTEMVYALGSGDAIVGTDDFSDFPAAAKSKAKVGGMQPNLEKIAALRPDLVIATTNGNHPSLAPALAALHIPLFLARTERLDDVPREMTRLGARLQSPLRDKAVADLRHAIDAQRRIRASRPRILFAVWADPLYVAGRNTFDDDLFVLAGCDNAVTVVGWPQYSLESVIAHPPDLVLFPDKSVTPQAIDHLFAAAPSLRKRVHVVPVDENVFTRPGPRVGEAGAMLNRIVDEWELTQRPSSALRAPSPR